MPRAWRYLSLALLVSGCASLPVRDHVKARRWGPACEAVRQREIGSDDLSGLEVTEALLAEMAPRVAVAILPPEAARNLLGVDDASPLLNRSVPVDWLAALVEMHHLQQVPGDPLESHVALAEVHLQVDAARAPGVRVGEVTLEVQYRSQRSPGSSDLSEDAVWRAPYRGLPADAESLHQAVAQALGLVRDPAGSGGGGGSGGSTLGFLGDLAVALVTLGTIDLNLRGSSESLLQTALGKDSAPRPTTRVTAKRWPDVDRLSALLARPCRLDASGRCTVYRIMTRAGAARPNWVDLRVDYVADGREGPCALTGFHAIGLPDLPGEPEGPARTRTRLAAVFPKGTRPAAELNSQAYRLDFARTSSREPSACPQGEPRCSAAPAADARCEDECRALGRCGDERGCRPRSPADCAASEVCRSLGACSLPPKTYACAPTTDAECRSGAACAERGWCVAEGTRCIAATDADCAAARVCATGGECVARKGVCRPSSDAACRASTGCRDFGQCALVGGTCRPAADADCAASVDCARYGLCRARDGVCVERE